MPFYNFKNKKTGEEFEERLSISEMEDKLKNDPNLDVIPSAPLIRTDSFVGKKPDAKFRSLLKNIKKKNKGSSINTF